jgi:RimJ/RimL family protein N-acetyltransferase
MSSPYAETLHTNRLTITQLDHASESDIKDLHYLSRAPFSRFVTEKRPYALDFVRDYLEKLTANHVASAPPNVHGVFYLVRLKDLTTIGIVFSFVRMRGLPLELALAFEEKHQGKGYGSEAVSAVMKEFERVGVREISAITDKENFACQGLLRKCGLVQKGSVIMRTRGERVTVDESGREKGGIELVGFVKPEMKGYEGEEVWTLIGYEE